MENYRDFVQFLCNNKQYENGIKAITTDGTLIYEAVEDTDQVIEFHIQAMLVIAKKLNLEIDYNYNSFKMAQSLALQNLAVFYLNDETCLLFLPETIEKKQYEKLMQTISTMDNIEFYLATPNKLYESKWNAVDLTEFFKINYEGKKRLKKTKVVYK